MKDILKSISFYQTKHEARKDTHFSAATGPQFQNNPSRKQRAEQCPRVYSETPRWLLFYKNNVQQWRYNPHGTSQKKKNLAVTSFRETDSLHQKQPVPPDELNPSVANEIN